MVKRVVVRLVAVTVMAAVAIWAVYARDMRRAYDRIRRGSDVVPSPFGDIEYAEGGAGPPVLVIHGSGGGFDQGELLAHAVLGWRRSMDRTVAVRVSAVHVPSRRHV